MQTLAYLQVLLLADRISSTTFQNSGAQAVVGLDGAARCNNSTFKTPKLFGAEILSITAAPLYDLHVLDFEYQSIFAAQPVCSVNITYTHPGVDDLITIYHILPLQGWNGRFAGLGGGGFAGYFPGTAQPSALRAGYATAGTDAGHDGVPFSPAAWALNSPGNVNYELMVGWGSKSLDDLPKIAKQIITNYYGAPPAFSYFMGCSGGGRQGMMSAQRYPNNYNGILANAPAINWSRFFASMLYPQLVMIVEGYVPSQCEFTAFTTASIKACDDIDGVVDGIVGDLRLCDFNPYGLIGTTIECGDDTVTISNEAANVVAKIWAGPKDVDGSRLWYPQSIGSEFSDTTSSTLLANGTRVVNEFSLPAGWFQYFVEKDALFDWRSLNYTTLAQKPHDSIREFESVIGTSDPNLRNFQATGGKLITYHGTIDQLIPIEGVFDYYNKVETLQPDVQDFYRFFAAPGVAHCTSNPDGTGYFPHGALAALAAWVENGTAPSSLLGSNRATGWEQPVCLYPQVAKWDGASNASLATSYTCEDHD